MPCRHKSFVFGGIVAGPAHPSQVRVETHKSFVFGGAEHTHGYGPGPSGAALATSHVVCRRNPLENIGVGSPDHTLSSIEHVIATTTKAYETLAAAGIKGAEALAPLFAARRLVEALAELLEEIEVEESSREAHFVAIRRLENLEILINSLIEG